MERISVNLSRPNFFPGQLIDYKDLNRLAAQADKVSALLCRYLFESGGIIVRAFEEFEVSSLKTLTLLVKPGIALLPNGQPVVLSKETVVDLSPYRKGKESRKIVVAVKNVLQGTDRYTDREDASISGYRTEALDAQIVIGTSASSDDGIELFRVTLAPDTESLRMATIQEEWKTELDAGVIDLRHRNTIVPQTFAPMRSEESLKVRQALYGIERAHSKMERIYLVDDPFTTVQYLTQLHAEMLARPFQPLKMAFLMSEFADKLSKYLDKLSSRLGAQRSNFDRETLLKAVALLDGLKEKQVLPRAQSWKVLPEVAELLMQFVDFAERKFSLVNTVEEALIDLRNRYCSMENKIVLGGHLFEQVDKLVVDDEDRVEIKAPTSFSRMLSTRFQNGDALTLKGKFIKEGMLTLKLQVPHPDRPIVLILHQYVRRAGSILHYEINGRHLITDQFDMQGEMPELSNHWMNRGIVVPAEQLVPQENTLRIRVQKSDLDFGFFDISVYQPSVIVGGAQ